MLLHFPTRRLFAAAVLLALLVAPRLAWGVIKLCMKDGTYQMVSSYEVKGDRIRYYSIERSDWEEVPADLVDFAATKRAEEEIKTTAKKQIEEAKEVDRERFYKPPATGLEVAPGIRLPGDDGIFTVDGQRLVRLVQSTGELVTDKKRAAMVLAVPLPVVKTRSLVVLSGPKAIIRLNNPLPVFYVQSADALNARLELVRIKSGKEARVVQEVETGRGKNAKPTEERTIITLERKQVAPNLYTLKPLQPLDAAEYALGELVGEKLNMEVWDFGYDKWEAVK